MPFKSKAQARWMWANDPQMAQRWADHTSDIKKLPEKVKEKEAMASIPGVLVKIAEQCGKGAEGIAKLNWGKLKMAMERGVPLPQAVAYGFPAMPEAKRAEFVMALVKKATACMQVAKKIKKAAAPPTLAGGIVGRGQPNAMSAQVTPTPPPTPLVPGALAAAGGGLGVGLHNAAGAIGQAAAAIGSRPGPLPFNPATAPQPWRERPLYSHRLQKVSSQNPPAAAGPVVLPPPGPPSSNHGLLAGAVGGGLGSGVLGAAAGTLGGAGVGGLYGMMADKREGEGRMDSILRNALYGAGIGGVGGGTLGVLGGTAAGGYLGRGMQAAGEHAQHLKNTLTEEQKAEIARRGFIFDKQSNIKNANTGLVGAGLGGLAGAAHGLMTHDPHDKEDSGMGRALRHGLIGAGVGGLAGWGAGHLMGGEAPPSEMVGPPELPNPAVPEGFNPAAAHPDLPVPKGMAEHVGELGKDTLAFAKKQFGNLTAGAPAAPAPAAPAAPAGGSWAAGLGDALQRTGLSRPNPTFDPQALGSMIGTGKDLLTGNLPPEAIEAANNAAMKLQLQQGVQGAAGGIGGAVGALSAHGLHNGPNHLGQAVGAIPRVPPQAGHVLLNQAR